MPRRGDESEMNRSVVALACRWRRSAPWSRGASGPVERGDAETRLAYNWMVSRLGPLFRTAGHRLRTQHAVSTSVENRQKRDDVEILNYLQDAAGARNLVFDLAVTHDRYGSSAQPH